MSQQLDGTIARVVSRKTIKVVFQDVITSLLRVCYAIDLSLILEVEVVDILHAVLPGALQVGLGVVLVAHLVVLALSPPLSHGSLLFLGHLAGVAETVDHTANRDAFLQVLLIGLL